MTNNKPTQELMQAFCYQSTNKHTAGATKMSKTKKEKQEIAKIFGVKPATVQSWIRWKDIDAAGTPAVVLLTEKTFEFLNKKAHRMRNSEKLNYKLWDKLRDEFFCASTDMCEIAQEQDNNSKYCKWCQEEKAESEYIDMFEMCIDCNNTVTAETQEPIEEDFLACNGKDAMIANLERQVEQERYKNFRLFQENCDIKTLINQQQMAMMLHVYGFRQKGNKVLQIQKPETDKRSSAWNMPLEPQMQLMSKIAKGRTGAETLPQS